jgi:hypothetical protein
MHRRHTVNIFTANTLKRRQTNLAQPPYNHRSPNWHTALHTTTTRNLRVTQLESCNPKIQLPKVALTTIHHYLFVSSTTSSSQKCADRQQIPSKPSVPPRKLSFSAPQTRRDRSHYSQLVACSLLSRFCRAFRCFSRI